MTSSEMTKQEQRNLDGFEGYEDEVEGGEVLSPASRIIQGVKLKYTNEARWEDNSGQEVRTELIAIDVLRVVQKWGKDNQPLETIMLAPGEKFPDIAALNEKCPRSEWRTDFNGNPAGPWAGQHIVYFVDPATMNRYTWPSPITTIGSARCVRDLVDQVKLMRRFRGQNVFAVVELSHAFMPTRFGGRERPLLIIKRWITLGPGALPAPDAPPIAGPATAPTAEPKPAAGAQSGMQTVTPPSANEVLSDSIPW